MLREISREEAKKMALDGQEVLKIYPGCDGSRVQSVNQAIDEIFDETSRFLVDEPEVKLEMNLPTEDLVKAGEEEAKKIDGRKKKKLKLDTGKIMALRNAGWSYDKIADEMGISSSTVYRAVAKEEGE